MSQALSAQYLTLEQYFTHTADSETRYEVCCWENGMCENTVHKQDEAVHSVLVPDFGLAPNAVFGE